MLYEVITNRFKTQYQQHKNPVKNLNWFSPLLKIASIIIILLDIYFSFFFNLNTQIQTLVSEKKTIELPDHRNNFV